VRGQVADAICGLLPDNYGLAYVLMQFHKFCFYIYLVTAGSVHILHLKVKNS